LIVSGLRSRSALPGRSGAFIDPWSSKNQII
jgi:hypothetical protein